MDKRKLKILVVDDYYPWREEVCDLLELLGYSEPDEAVEGNEALEVLRDPGGFHCVITDINMSGMDGITLLQHIKADPALRHIQVLVMSSTISRAYIGQGALDFIRKPFDKNTLEQKMNRVLAKLASG